MPKVILYARVSQDDLNCENQKKLLFEWVKNRPDYQDYEYRQETTTTRKTRPIKEEILKDVREYKTKIVVVTRLDRWARSLTELVSNVEEIINANGAFIAISNGFEFRKDSYNASQQLLLSIFGSFAQFEREIIRERTREGLARVVAQGKRLGRPRKTPPGNPAEIQVKTVSL